MSRQAREIQNLLRGAVQLKTRGGHLKWRLPNGKIWVRHGGTKVTDRMLNNELSTLRRALREPPRDRGRKT